MNWFERHLNGTAFIILATTPMAVALVFCTSIGWFSPFDYLELPRQTFLTIIFLVLAYGLLLLHIYGFIWVLRKKRRGPAAFLLLIFFLPVLAFTYYGFTAPRPWLGPPAVVAPVFVSPLILLGWTGVLLLRSRPALTETGPAKSRLNRWFALVSACFIVLLSLASGTYMRAGTTTFDSPADPETGVPAFSFKYPAYLVFQTETHGFPYAWSNAIGSSESSFFNGTITTTCNIFVHERVDTFGPADYLAKPGPLIHDYFGFLPAHYLSSAQDSWLSTEVNEYSAVWSKFQSPEGWAPFTYYAPASLFRTTATVFTFAFEHGDYYWIIQVASFQPADDPPAWLPGLLDTFTVYD